MYALVYSSNYTDEDPPSQKRPFSVCPRCGRFIRIDGHCECEAIFLVSWNIKNSKSKWTKSSTLMVHTMIQGIF